MFELRGAYNTAKVFTDNADSNCVAQVINLLNQRSSENSQIRIMPDCHAGAGCVIGTTMTITDKVIPGLVGVDIGCGMLVIQLEEKRINLPELDNIIQKRVPSGRNIREKASEKAKAIDCEELKCFNKKNCNVNPVIFQNSIGTLGGGNHFIEIDKDDEGNLYLVIHTGSRRSGKDVAEYYQKNAYNAINLQGEFYKKIVNDQKEDFIKKMKAEGKAHLLSELLKTWKPEISVPEEHVCYEFAYCSGSLFKEYMHDMRIMQLYAHINREVIADTILKYTKLHEVDRFETIHNYIDMKNMILRKGAVSAEREERLLIPINMRDGSLICSGKGNPDWNYSAPHGAGRIMSRSEAKNSISMKDFKESMNGIYTTSVSKDTIDESAFAYKPMNEIMENIQDTVEIEKIIKPIYNFKAGGE